MRERIFGSMSRVITLPADVTDEGANASFKNGILEVRLSKRMAPKKGTIEID
jgi:HSP20 family protein